jgi:hypothetical protein
MTALGIGTLAAAIIIYIPTVVGLIVNESVSVLAGNDWWRNQTAAATTLAILGTPLWSYHWATRQREASIDSGEISSLSRKMVVYAAVLAGALGALGSLSHLLYLLLDAILESELSLTLLRSGKWSLGILGASLFFAPYYWFVLKADRRALGGRTTAEVATERKQVTIVIGSGLDGFVRDVEAELGQKVHVLRAVNGKEALEPLPSSEALRDLCTRIRRAQSDRVLVIMEGDKDPKVMPYH